MVGRTVNRRYLLRLVFRGVAQWLREYGTGKGTRPSTGIALARRVRPSPVRSILRMMLVGERHDDLRVGMRRAPESWSIAVECRDEGGHDVAHERGRISGRRDSLAQDRVR